MLCSVAPGARSRCVLLFFLAASFHARFSNFERCHSALRIVGICWVLDSILSFPIHYILWGYLISYPRGVRGQ
ncbi:hypothetical protein T492DRAFT_1021343 [Pavlovales sp. CCMP2436]|nr:hypothetical protein T492DRAFT_1021343 [Pavlovales sp. CCMP2436]